ncbi:MAG: hypothetical protein GX589_04325 [Deltaproteobacteria bacterium]|nr:hypothetical protein [Deltaproteobacteria bacterium]
MASKATKIASAWYQLSAAVCLGWCLYAAAPVCGQSSAEIPVEIYHETPEPSEIPPPGEPLSINVQLLGSRDITMKMIAFLAIDGQLTQAPLENRYLNAYDRPEFSLKIHAPQTEMSYQFVLYKPDGKALSSVRYQLRRPCRLNTALSSAEEVAKLQGEERLNSLVVLARNLKLHSSAYAQAITLLQELKEMIKE